MLEVKNYFVIIRHFSKNDSNTMLVETLNNWLCVCPWVLWDIRTAQEPIDQNTIMYYLTSLQETIMKVYENSVMMCFGQGGFNKTNLSSWIVCSCCLYCSCVAAMGQLSQSKATKYLKRLV